MRGLVRGAARLSRCSKRSEEGFFIVDEAGILRSRLPVEGVGLLFTQMKKDNGLMILDVRALPEAHIVPRTSPLSLHEVSHILELFSQAFTEESCR